MKIHSRASLFYVLQNMLDKLFPLPTSEERREFLKVIICKYDLRVFVETGTAQGHTIEAIKDCVDFVYSIELDEELFRRAHKRFEGDKRITVLRGDGGKVLGSLMGKIKQPALFWLDAHSGDESSAMEELKAILNAPRIGHVIIIDDARLFGRRHGFPSLKALRELVEKANYGEMSLRDDSIRILPAS